MARYYGSIRGSGRTDATRAGTAASGIRAHIRGWDVGARVDVVDRDGVDVVTVSATGGSNESARERDVAEIRNVGGRLVVSIAGNGPLTTYADIVALVQAASVVLGFGFGYMSAAERDVVNEKLTEGMRARLEALSDALKALEGSD